MLTQLNLAIVGHANVGKTSLLRTLTEDSQFGSISNKAGTTKHVEAITFTLSENNKIIFYDTPGLEDSIAFYDYIEKINANDAKRDGVDKLNYFLTSPEAELQFEQEAKVVRQLLKSDAALYVVDVREPILDKYHDELAVLAYSDKPILAVLNYTANSSPYEAEWKRLLSRVGIHTSVRFDAVFPSIDGEERLYQSLILLLEPAKQVLSLWQNKIIQQREQRNQTAKLIIAEALVDVTAYTEFANKKELESMALVMQNKVRERESQAINALLKLYRFNSGLEDEKFLPIVNGRFNSDLFNKEALKLIGVQLSKGVVSGAAIGAGVDLAVGGITLGSAALLGAAIGGITQVARHYGSRMKGYFSGNTKMTIDDSVVCFLSLRLIQLVDGLNTRGHANQLPINLPELDKIVWQKGQLPKSLSIARVYPQWSPLNHNKISNKQQKQEAINNVAQELV